MSTNKPKPTFQLPDMEVIDVQTIDGETTTTTHNLSDLLSSYTLTNEAKNTLEKQRKEMQTLIFSTEHTKSLNYDADYVMETGEESNIETFRLRSSSTTSISVNKLLLLQYGLTDAQINEAVKEKTTRYWIVEKVKAKTKKDNSK